MKRLPLIVLSLALSFAPIAASANHTVVLDRLPHVHGLGVDPAHAGQLLVATHEGFFRVAPEGVAVHLSATRDDLMGFAPDPTNPDILYASGHPANGGNLGVLRSDDGGRTWRRLAAGVGGPVDFHAMDVSAADPNVIYGVQDGGFQTSRDGGRAWMRRGDSPGEVFDIAASSVDPETVYAATKDGLLFSRDSGATWKPAYFLRRPATMVQALPDGTLYTFVYGIGLLVTKEPSFAWKKVAGTFADKALMKIAVDGARPERLFGLADSGALMASRDGGRNWTTFENFNRSTAETVERGRAMFEENCQVCHGARGVGERPEDMYAKDEFGFVAPPLDDSAHGWHHSDRDLVEFILNGSPRNERMIPWKETLTHEDAADLVTYIKSLWNFRSLACQGARHMSCM